MSSKSSESSILSREEEYSLIESPQVEETLTDRVKRLIIQLNESEMEPIGEYLEAKLRALQVTDSDNNENHEIGSNISHRKRILSLEDLREANNEAYEKLNTTNLRSEAMDTIIGYIDGVALNRVYDNVAAKTQETLSEIEEIFELPYHTYQAAFRTYLQRLASSNPLLHRFLFEGVEGFLLQSIEKFLQRKYLQLEDILFSGYIADSIISCLQREFCIDEETYWTKEGNDLFKSKLNEFSFDNESGMRQICQEVLQVQFLINKRLRKVKKVNLMTEFIKSQYSQLITKKHRDLYCYCRNVDVIPVLYFRATKRGGNAIDDLISFVIENYERSIKDEKFKDFITQSRIHLELNSKIQLYSTPSK